jgi:hypothetical protein
MISRNRLKNKNKNMLATFIRIADDCSFCLIRKNEHHQVCANCKILLHKKGSKDYEFRYRLKRQREKKEREKKERDGEKETIEEKKEREVREKEENKKCSCGYDHGIFSKESEVLCEGCYYLLNKNKKNEHQ